MVETTKENCSIKRRYWGEIDGSKIYLFTITNSNGSVLEITNYGAAVTSLVLNDNKGEKRDVVLGYRLLEDYVADKYYMGTVVGRYANRIGGSEVLIDGKKYNISSEEGAYHLHGGKEGFNKKIWNVVDYNEGTIKLSYLSKDGEEGFPGNLTITVTYIFDNEDTWTLNYEATTDQPTLLNLTHHAYFNLDGHHHGTILNHELKINADKYLPVTELQVPTGTLAEVAGTPFDFLEKKAIGRSINETHEQLQLSGGLDHSWILNDRDSKQLKYAATLNSNRTGIYLNVFTTEPALHVYSGNYLNGVAGKNNMYYEKRSGLCLETQHYPDAPNNHHFPSTVLMPGEIFRSTTIFQFITIKKGKD